MGDSLFDRVRNNVDIAEVIGEYVNLIPKGKNLFGICPFHNDSNPSMSVSRERGIYTCFTCKNSGDVIKFVSEYKHMSYGEAAFDIARSYHIDISEFNSEKHDKTRKLYEIMDISHRFFKYLMNDEEYSKSAREYLHDRGITDKTIDEFEIGLSSKDDDALFKMLSSKNYLPTDIRALSLSNASNHDMFQNRIIVPIRDEQGRPIAFGGRIYEKADKDKGINKYLNSENTPIFKKGETVFNLDKASRAVRDSGFLIINEGYMDVVQAYSNGVYNSVAIMGTAMTPEHAQALRKYTKDVVICLDGDNAGVKGVMNCIERCEENGLNFSVVILKENLDPDEFIRKYGVKEYLRCINEERLDKFGYLYKLTKVDYPEITSFNIDSFKNEIFKRLKPIKSQVQIDKYLQLLASDLKVSVESVKQDFNTFVGFRPIPIQRNVNKVDDFKIEGGFNKAEELLVNYGLKSHVYYNEIEQSFGHRLFMKNVIYRTVFMETGDIYDVNPKQSTESIIDELKTRGVYNDFAYNPNIKYSMDDLIEIIKRIENEEKKKEIKSIKEKLKQLSTKDDSYISLVQRYTKLQMELKGYEKGPEGIHK